MAGDFQVAFFLQLVDVFAGDKLDFAIGIAGERHANTGEKNILIDWETCIVVVGSTTTGLPCALAIGSAPRMRVPFIGNGHQILGFNAEPATKPRSLAAAR